MVLASLAGCARGPLHEKHPLQDVIVDAASGSVISRAHLIDEMAAAAVVYLGEKHDNTEHHRHQLWLLQSLVDNGQRPALGLEIFSVDQSALLMEYVAGKPRHGSTQTPEEQLRAGLGWGSSWDENWPHYGPLLRLAREHALAVFGIDLPTALRRRISRGGIAGLTSVERAQVPEVGPATPSYRALMLENIKQSHCGHGSESYLARLFENWQARNETMARAIAAAASGRDGAPVLVVVGSGHVRHGQGVIQRVRAHLPDAHQLNLGFQEVHPDHRDLDYYLSATGLTAMPATPPHERLWLTASDGLTAADACARFGKVLKTHG
jgi:uncharacterized iron-regulated protein